MTFASSWPSYKVFLGAPTTAELRNQNTQDSADNLTWRAAEGPLHRENDATISRTDSKAKAQSQRDGLNLIISPQISEESREWIMPAATLNAATQRISEMYKNVIFPDDEEDDEDSWVVKDEEYSRDDSRLDISGEYCFRLFPLI